MLMKLRVLTISQQFNDNKKFENLDEIDKFANSTLSTVRSRPHNDSDVLQLFCLDRFTYMAHQLAKMLGLHTDPV